MNIDKILERKSNENRKFCEAQMQFSVHFWRTNTIFFQNLEMHCGCHEKEQLVEKINAVAKLARKALPTVGRETSQCRDIISPIRWIPAMVGPRLQLRRISLTMTGPRLQLRRTLLPMAGPKHQIRRPSCLRHLRALRRTFLPVADRPSALELTKFCMAGRSRGKNIDTKKNLEAALFSPFLFYRIACQGLVQTSAFHLMSRSRWNRRSLR